jgi:hypothetical protein
MALLLIEALVANSQPRDEIAPMEKENPFCSWLVEHSSGSSPFKQPYIQPSFPIDSVGQPTIASIAALNCSGASGCRYATLNPMSSLRRKVSGAVSRHISQSMQEEST